LGVAAQILNGRLALKQGSVDDGIAALTEAVRLQDTLEYDEPPAWYYPVRQSLGAALLTAGRASDAERVYREDLQQYPGNGWSLFGLTESLRAQGRATESAQSAQQFQRAWQSADVSLQSSQF
jgi:tetratricopeptide (TPR) repeat protein